MADDAVRALVLTRAARPAPPAYEVARLAENMPNFGTDVSVTLPWVIEAGRAVLERGDTTMSSTWEALAVAASIDVAAARMLEPHVDAGMILRQAGAEEIFAAGTTWGVFAAEGPGVRLQASLREGEWQLDGTKPWCSLAESLSSALVTAWTSADTRRLFAVDLRSPSVHAHPGPWVARGLAPIISAPVDFHSAVATPIGADEWYSTRAGFAWGGIGVAAVWWGGVTPLLETLRAAASRDGADQLAQAALGRADVAWWTARTSLADAAARAEHPSAADPPVEVLAARVRAVVADAVETILTTADHALGPAPLTADEGHARRVDDLRIYVRQHHAERDLARLGRKLTS